MAGVPAARGARVVTRSPPRYRLTRKPDRRRVRATQPTEVDGITFHSKREARRYCQLKILEHAGEITGLELQPRFNLVIDGRPVVSDKGRQLHYTADFRYFDVKADRVRVEDVKGFETEAARLRRYIVQTMTQMKIELT